MAIKEAYINEDEGIVYIISPNENREIYAHLDESRKIIVESYKMGEMNHRISEYSLKRIIDPAYVETLNKHFSLETKIEETNNIKRGILTNEERRTLAESEMAFYLTSTPKKIHKKLR